jgi:hypothetical protein
MPMLDTLMSTRWSALFISVVGLGVGCAPAGGPGSNGGGAAAGTETVALTIDHRSEWRVLWVEGETDLPDGAYINYRVTHELARTAPVEQWPSPNLIESGRATVQEGEYWARVNTLNWPAGAVDVVVQFPLPPQPPDVVRRYGEFGEQLTGDNVTVLNGMKAVEVRHTLQHDP